MRDLTLLAWMTQLGPSVAVPLIAFPLLGVWLQTRFGWGAWVFWVLLTIGVFSAFGGLRSSLRAMARLSHADGKKKSEDEPPLSFSEHD